MRFNVGTGLTGGLIDGAAGPEMGLCWMSSLGRGEWVDLLRFVSCGLHFLSVGLVASFEQACAGPF